MKYILANICLIVGFVPAYFLGMVGVEFVFTLHGLSGFFGMMFFSTYLIVCAITTAVSIKRNLL